MIKKAGVLSGEICVRNLEKTLKESLLSCEPLEKFGKNRGRCLVSNLATTKRSQRFDYFLTKISDYF